MSVFGQAIERDKKQRELREQTQRVANPIGTNDFDYEDEQKSQDSITVYEGLHFDLAAENSNPPPPSSFFFLLQIISYSTADAGVMVVPSLYNNDGSCFFLLRVVQAFGASAE